MTELQKKMMQAAGLTEDDFTKQPTAQDVAEAAYLLAEYNNILIETLMEE